MSLKYLPALFLCMSCSSPTPPDTQPDDESSTMDAGHNEDSASPDATTSNEPVALRVATFNASMFRSEPGALITALEQDEDPQIAAVAHIIQTVRPDVLLLNEFDWDEAGQAARLMRESRLSKPAAGGLEGIDYPYVFVPETNTGIASGADLDKNGRVVTTPGSRDYGNDAFGYGIFPGQYGMIILSKYPVMASRTFRELAWKEFPDALIPADWYLPEAVEVMRLSSKNHVDVTLDVEGRAFHVLASHPTPPSFDGDEDRNGKRNHDEIKLWEIYLTRGLMDDAGERATLPDTEPFVIMGDLNSDPEDGGSLNAAIRGLIGLARVQDPEPRSAGASAASTRDGQANTTHQGDPALDTADFSDGRVGNLRVDYVLPSRDLVIKDSAVVWPAQSDPLHEVTQRASDHHMVWIDIQLP